jgi:hypothetical protein
LAASGTYEPAESCSSTSPSTAARSTIWSRTSVPTDIWWLCVQATSPTFTSIPTGSPGTAPRSRAPASPSQRPPRVKARTGSSSTSSTRGRFALPISPSR